VLKNVDVIYAEDTRSALKLLTYLNIRKKINSFHKDNEKEVAKHILYVLKNSDIAIISEAGTPGISDPGNFLTQLLAKENIDYEVLPGATAVIPAVVKSGFPTENFYFYGFLSHKKRDKIKEIEKLSTINSTLIIYESPHRLKETLYLLLEKFYNICVIRELTKIYEEKIYVFSRDDVEKITIKGEFVIVIDNNKVLSENKDSFNFDLKKVIKELKIAGFSNRDILKIIKAFGLKRNEAYEILTKEDG
jgi:16S rRNA (cytidine1402-2'-O)-methyltransferase